MATVALLSSGVVEPYLAHLVRLAHEPGPDGAAAFGAYSAREVAEVLEPGRLRPLVLSRWAKPVEALGWERAWGVFAPGGDDDGGDRIVGHLDLRAAKLPAAGHRAELGMGVEREHRRGGLGRRLLEAAIEWARREPGVAWIDLGVFAHNEAARRLYETCGFVEVGSVPDRFRVDGRSIEDVRMTLRVG